MSEIVWSDALATGIAPIDNDHKVLVDLLNQVRRCRGDAEERAVLGTVLKSLDDYTVFHFRREEALQEGCGFPGFLPHRERHRDFEAKVRAYREAYVAGTGNISAGQLSEFLEGWLVGHIQGEDMRFVDAVRTNPDVVASIEKLSFGGETNPTDGGALNILVIDDNPNFRRVLLTILTAIGLKDVAVAASGEEAIHQIGFRPYDMILCDFLLQGMNGLELVRSLRATPNGKNAYVAMVTGYATDGFDAQAQEAGANEVLVKPVSPRGLAETARRAATAKG